VRLTAEADNANWQADGMDLQHVRIVAVDKRGRRVQLAQGEVTFRVEGDAQIVGVVNGDINSPEPMVGDRRSLFNGSCTAILRAGHKAGTVMLTASAPGMKPVKLKLNVQ
jgi:beta-galactosidase